MDKPQFVKVTDLNELFTIRRMVIRSEKALLDGGSSDPVLTRAKLQNFREMRAVIDASISNILDVKMGG